MREVRADELARLINQAPDGQIRTRDDVRTHARAAGWRSAVVEIAVDDLHLDGRLDGLLQRTLRDARGDAA